MATILEVSIVNLSQLRYAITSHLRQSSISSVDIKYYVELANELIELDGANNIKSLSLNVTALAAQLTNCEVKAQQYRLIAELLLDIRSKQPSRPFECLNITCSDCGEKAEYSYSFFVMNAKVVIPEYVLIEVIIGLWDNSLTQLSAIVVDLHTAYLRTTGLHITVLVKLLINTFHR